MPTRLPQHPLDPCPLAPANALRFAGSASRTGEREIRSQTEAESVPASDVAPVSRHRIVIVGGGAGGLQLCARLGNIAGRRGDADIVLVDVNLAHVWKPLLHEVAAGTLRASEHKIDYLQQARRHHFRFHLGHLDVLERSTQRIWLAPIVDEDGMEIAPRRSLSYDTLVIAIGAIDDDFNTPGAAENAMSLNNLSQAERFHHRLLALCARAEFEQGEPVEIVIVGGGATGVELVAELADAAEEIASYGVRLRQLCKPVRLTLIEAGKRILGPLPDEIARRVHEQLTARGITIRVGKPVAEVCPDKVILDDGESIKADLTVWAAGVKGTKLLERLDGLKTNRQRQLVVGDTLQTTEDENIFAFGDCASCTSCADRNPVPPTAQAAQQQASLLSRSLHRRAKGEAPLMFSYHDRGKLISLGEKGAIGSLYASPAGRITVRGLPARLGYWILYRRHLTLLLGPVRTLAVTLGHWLSRRTRSRVKLH